jgi:hypothetical protein
MLIMISCGNQPKWENSRKSREVKRTKTIHILVSPLTIADTTGKRPQTPLCLAFHLAKLPFGDLETRAIIPVDDDTFLSEKGLQCLQVLWWRKVARAVCHVILEPVRLLVGLVAVWLWATEWLGKEE